VLAGAGPLAAVTTTRKGDVSVAYEIAAADLAPIGSFVNWFSLSAYLIGMPRFVMAGQGMVR
jgi:hypothetical protein